MALRVVETNRGALERTLAMLEEDLAPAGMPGRKAART